MANNGKSFTACRSPPCLAPADVPCVRRVFELSPVLSGDYGDLQYRTLKSNPLEVRRSDCDEMVRDWPRGQRVATTLSSREGQVIRRI
jgi:hypothetical protein